MRTVIHPHDAVTAWPGIDEVLRVRVDVERRTRVNDKLAIPRYFAIPCLIGLVQAEEGLE